MSEIIASAPVPTPVAKGNAGGTAGGVGQETEGESFGAVLEDTLGEGAPAEETDVMEADAPSPPDEAVETAAETADDPPPAPLLALPPHLPPPEARRPGVMSRPGAGDEALSPVLADADDTLFETLAGARRASGSGMRPDVPAVVAFDERLADTLPERGTRPVLSEAASPLAVEGLDKSSARIATARVPDAARIEVPMGRPGWEQALGERVRWLVGQEVQQARIQLNPEHLGPIEIRVETRNEQLSVAIAASHGATQDAINASLARLREMLASPRFEQVDVQLAGQSFAHTGQPGQGRGESAAGFAAGDADWDDEPDGLAMAPTVMRGAGLLDDYA